MMHKAKSQKSVLAQVAELTISSQELQMCLPVCVKQGGTNHDHCM